MKKCIFVFFGCYLFLLLVAWLVLNLLAASRLIPGFDFGFTSSADLMLHTIMATIFVAIANFFAAGCFVYDYERAPSAKESLVYALFAALAMVVASSLAALVMLTVLRSGTFVRFYVNVLVHSIELLRPFAFDIFATSIVLFSILCVVNKVLFSWSARKITAQADRLDMAGSANKASFRP